MSRLLAKIMLALLMLPLAALVYGLVAAIGLEYIFQFRSDIAPFVLSGLVTSAFVAISWICLWRATVIWTRERVSMTASAGVIALVGGALVGGCMAPLEVGFGVFVGGIAVILLWLVGTVFVWRETPAERAGRVLPRGTRAIVCPVCGYNMTGLEQSHCPECGGRFTIDELMARQPGRDQAELEVEGEGGAGAGADAGEHRHGGGHTHTHGGEPGGAGAGGDRNAVDDGRPGAG